MSDFICEDPEKFDEKYTNILNKEMAEFKPNDYLEMNYKIDFYRHTWEELLRVNFGLSHSKSTPKSTKYEIFKGTQNIHWFLKKKMHSVKLDRAKANFRADVYFSNMQKKINDMVEEEPITSSNYLPPKNRTKQFEIIGNKNVENGVLRVRHIEKTRSMIIKMNYAEKFLKPIKAYLSGIPIKTLKLLDEKRILVTFTNPPDCTPFKKRLQRIFPGTKIFEEPEEYVEVVIGNIGNISRETFKQIIEEMTGERPRIIRHVEIKKGEIWRVQIGLSSLGTIKLLSQGDATIKIGDVESEYFEVPEEFIRMGYGREELMYK